MRNDCFIAVGDTVNQAVTTTSATTAVVSDNYKAGSVRVYNSGPSTVFMKFGDSNVTVTVDNGVPVPSGAVEVYSLLRITHIACITASGTATIYFTPGEGF